MWYIVVVTVAVGAVIGYITNWLAIKMLFRPYKEIRFLGRRLPFTPGVIPKERYRLSESIGDVITTDLLTPEDFKAHFMSEKFTKDITVFIQDALHKLLDTPLRTLAFSQDRAVSLLTFLGQLLTEFLKTEGLSKMLMQAVRTGLYDLLDKPLKDFITQNQAAIIFEALDDSEKRLEIIRRIIGANENTNSERMHDIEDLETDTSQISRPVLRAYINEEKLTGAFRKAFKEFGPGIQKDFILYCKKPEIHKQLETLAITIIKNYMQKMNALQRLIINIGGFDSAIYESIPATVDEAIKAIGEIFINSDIHSRIADELAKKLLRTEELSSNSAAKNTITQYEELADTLLGSFSFKDFGSAWYRYASGKPLRSLVNMQESQQTAQLTASQFFASFSEPESRLLDTLVHALKASLAQFIDSITKEEPDKTLRTLLKPEPEFVVKLSEIMGSFIVSVLVQQIPMMLKLVDIKELVKNKLDALDMAMLENLTIKVMNKELKAITMLGGILGAIIGLFQALIIQYIR